MNLQKENESLKTEIVFLKAKLDELEELVRHLHRGRFAAKSELLSHPGMTPLFEQPAAEEPVDPDDENEISVSPHKRSKKRKPLPKDLPREDHILDLPEEEQACPCCQGMMKQSHEKVSEKLHIKPAEFSVKRYIRKVYSCKACEVIKEAKMPPHPIPKSGVTPESIAHIATMKIIDGLPLHRIEQMFKRHDLDLNRDRMSRWLISIGELLKPIKEQMHRDLLAGDIFGIDETSMQVLAEENRRPDQKSFMIVQAREGPPGKSIVLYHYEKSKAARTIEPYIQGFKGAMVSDGLSVYQNLTAEYETISHGGCLAHARRKFAEAVKGKKKRMGIAKEALLIIKEVFSVEAQLKGSNNEEVAIVRAQQSRLLMDRLKELCDENINQIPAKSLTGKALSYLNGQWEYLTRFLDDPRLPAHNNYVEQRIRKFVIGRKAWLFAQSTQGAHSAATLYSLMHTARDNGLNPYQYLCDVLLRVNAGADIKSLMPYK